MIPHEMYLTEEAMALLRKVEEADNGQFDCWQGTNNTPLDVHFTQGLQRVQVLGSGASIEDVRSVRNALSALEAAGCISVRNSMTTYEITSKGRSLASKTE